MPITGFIFFIYDAIFVSGFLFSYSFSACFLNFYFSESYWLVARLALNSWVPFFSPESAEIAGVGLHIWLFG